MKTERLFTPEEVQEMCNNCCTCTKENPDLCGACRVYANINLVLLLDERGLSQ